MDLPCPDAVTENDVDEFFRKYCFNFVISDPREPDNPIIFASEGFFQMTGYEPSDILNKNCRILQGPGTSTQAIMEIRDAIREERSTSVCLLNYKKNKTPFWNAFHLSPIKNSSGLVEYYIGIQVDVTTLVGTGNNLDEASVQEIALKELAQARELAQDVQQNAAELLLKQCHHSCAVDNSVSSSLLGGLSGIAGSFVLSDPRLPDMPMVYCSPGFLKLTGYSCEELVGRNCRVLQGPETDPAAVQKFRDAIAEKRPVTVSLLNYRKGGTPFNNCVHIAPIRDAAGQVQFFCGVQIDLGSPGRSTRRVSAAGEDAMLSAGDNGREEQGRDGDRVEELEPTGMQLLQQKGTVGAVRVAARAFGLRRAAVDQGFIAPEQQKPE